MKEFTFFFWTDSQMFIHHIKATSLDHASEIGNKIRSRRLGNAVEDDPRWQCTDKLIIFELDS